MKRFLLIAGIASLPTIADAQAYKPDFNCAADHSKDSIATMLCENSDAAKHELMFDQTYYALRQLVGKAGWKYLKQEAIADDDIFKECIAPADPNNPDSLPPADPSCYISHMDALTEKYKHRLSGGALEEANRPIDQHILLQQQLITLGYLPSSAQADGVYGEATRDAIETWQRVNHRPATDGFLSDQDAQALLSGSPSASASASISANNDISAVNPSGSAASSTDNAPPETSAYQPPSEPTEIDKEESLISIVNEGCQEYTDGQNDFQKGAARPRRASRICKLLQDPVVTGWYGTVDNLSSSSSGYGVLTIRISPHITVGTTNNSLSDSLGPQKTLISPSDPVFSQVANLHVGQHIIFSGRFSTSNDDCIEETSITQEGSMTDPDFEMRFTDVKPVN